MSTKPPRPRKQRQKDDMKQEIVVQVHKTIKKDHAASTTRTDSSDKSSESHRTYIMEDKNDNYSLKTPSRDVSVDEEAQINGKIVNLIETEMKRDINKQSHFTDSRPQSLSFYEDEKMPEELSGNLELLSPEERRHYKRRKEYLDIDMERNAYNAMQDNISRESDEIIATNKKSKRDKRKKHAVDAELGLGDSREMMIPKEKRKSKKKKREYSPVSSSTGKRKHKKKDEDFEPRNDITLALEELQDDVFENAVDEYVRAERMRKSPKKSDRLYVQKKGKFEPARTDPTSGRYNNMNCPNRSEMTPIEFASLFQQCCIPLGTLCHGFLGGLALAHYLYLRVNGSPEDDTQFYPLYANYSDVFTCIFYLLNVACLISVFDKCDLAHMDPTDGRDLLRGRTSFVVILIYLACLFVHLAATVPDYKLGMMKGIGEDVGHANATSTIDYFDSNATEHPPSTLSKSGLDVSDCPSNCNLETTNRTNVYVLEEELFAWYNLSQWRAILAVLGWILVACCSSDNLLHVHLKNMEKYAIAT